jgi:fructose-specific phosphotransferase system IIC component
MSILGSAELFTEDFGDPLDAHGFVQKIILEEGVLGLLFFGLFLGYVLQRLWKYQAAREKDYLLFQIFFISVLGAIVFQLFNTSYFNANMWMPIGIALAGLQLYVFGENYAFKK